MRRLSRTRNGVRQGSDPCLTPFLLLLLLLTAAIDAQAPSYRRSNDWAQLPAGTPWAAVIGAEQGPDGNMYVLHRCFENSCAGRSEPPFLVFDPSGRLIRSWGAGMFVFPHGFFVDRDGSVWATDARGGNGKGHQVFKFSPDGKVLLTIGKAGTAGEGPDVFNQPTDVVVAPSGDIFVADGHRETGNSRIVKFSRNGTFIKAWGKRGSAPGEFYEPHTIAIDSRGRIFVGDRVNNRIQIFDQDGTFIDQWKQFGRPSGIFIDKDDTIYVADSESATSAPQSATGLKKGIRIGSARTGAVTGFIEDIESATSEPSGAEGVGVDASGNVYGAVVRRQMLERFSRP
jgi:sugar lactone lactonase YvrE